MAWSISRGDLRALDVLRDYPDNHFDGLFADPPYGLSPDGRARTWDQIDHQRARGGFMGQSWDAAVPGETFWRECLRVLKPGAPLLAYCGTRTYHRMVCAVEDAGFDVRDMLAFLHSAGFPKYLAMDKAIDAAAGAARPVTGSRVLTGSAALSTAEKGGTYASNTSSVGRSKTVAVTGPASDLSAAWSGYTSALKPAMEDLVFARKPSAGAGLATEISKSVLEATCLLPSHASVAGLRSTSAPAVSAAPRSDSALWHAVRQCSTPDDLFALTDTWPSESGLPSSLSTASSWLRILAECCDVMSTYTTEITSSLTTDLKTLSCFRSEITPGLIIQAATWPQDMTPNASLVAELFCACASRLRVIRALSAPGLAISSAGAEGLRPSIEPLVLARKPLDGTYAENALKWGVGGLAIDACRIRYASDEDQAAAAAAAAAQRLVHEHHGVGVGEFGHHGANARASLEPYLAKQSLGRYPANILLDEEAAAMLDSMVGDRPSMLTGRADPGKAHAHTSNAETASWFHGGAARGTQVYADGGGPSRFFFTAKVSKWERDFGCDELDNVGAGDMIGRAEDSAGMTGRAGSHPKGGARNNHPTLKGIAQTEYFAKLLLPPKRADGQPRRLLVPFSGAGSEMIGALRAGWDEVHGIEQSERFIAIASARIERWLQAQAGLDVKEARAAASSADTDERQVPLFGKTGT